jgi:hypothetical protein
MGEKDSESRPIIHNLRPDGRIGSIKTLFPVAFNECLRFQVGCKYESLLHFSDFLESGMNVSNL